MVIYLVFYLVLQDSKGSVSLMFKHTWQRLPLHFAEPTFLSFYLTKKLFKLLTLWKETKILNCYGLKNLDS